MSLNMTRRELALCALADSALATLPAGVGAANSPASTPAPTSTDPFQHVDPELRAAAREREGFTKILASLSTATIGGTRAALDSQPPAFDGSVPVVRQKIAGPGRGAPEVGLYVINARVGSRRPAILHMHGGGFVLGTAAGDVPRLQAMAASLDCVIVSVDYRLAPETDYRGSIEDNYAALRWLFGNAATLGVDPAHVIVMGESAGGGHAALLAITARDRGEFRIAYQMLIYPMLDDRTGSINQPPPHIGQIVWTPAANRFGWRSFLGQEPGGASVPVAAVPARTRDLSGLPPAFIGVGALDLFVDEDIEYARRLINAGVQTELLVLPGAFHGFDYGVPDAAIVRRFNDARMNALRKGLALPAG